MSETPDREFRRKAHFDLWVHQNTLFWSRFPLLGVLQGGFFAIAVALKGHALLVGSALALTLILSMVLYNTVDQDRQHRNRNEKILKDDFGFELRSSKLSTVPLLSVTAMEVLFQLVVFLPFAVVDLVVAVWAMRGK
jgi:hypothetical protein